MYYNLTCSACLKKPKKEPIGIKGTFGITHAPHFLA